MELSGETDLNNARAFRAVLAGLGDRDHLDLTRRRFVDVAGLHAREAFTAARPHVTVSVTDHLAGLLNLSAVTGAVTGVRAAPERREPSGDPDRRPRP